MSTTARVLLELLDRYGPNYGLGLQSHIRGRGFLGRLEAAWMRARIYTTLRSLERQGFLESYEADAGMPERGGRPRIYYRLTDKGREYLRQEALT